MLAWLHFKVFSEITNSVEISIFRGELIWMVKLFFTLSAKYLRQSPRTTFFSSSISSSGCDHIHFLSICALLSYSYIPLKRTFINSLALSLECQYFEVQLSMLDHTEPSSQLRYRYGKSFAKTNQKVGKFLRKKWN